MKVIILAGGSGTRLWPLSTEKHPKQFIRLPGTGESLFQQTFKRSLLLAAAEDIYVVANARQVDLILKDIEEIDVEYDENNVIFEPEAKNTLPAIYAGVSRIAQTSHETVVVFPSDHVIEQSEKFVDIIRESERLADEFIVTFGIIPYGPKTGYGYISPGGKKLNGYRVESFKEKPTLEKALRYIEEGCLWNAGIFMFNSSLFVEETQKYAPDVYEAFEAGIDMDQAYGRIQRKISVDYGLMEKSDRVAVVPMDVGWNDVGDFDAFCDLLGENVDNNVVINSENTIIHSASGKPVVVVDADDLMIIESEEGLLVCMRGSSQKVKDAVEELKNRERGL